MYVLTSLIIMAETALLSSTDIPTVERAANVLQGLIDCLRKTFVTSCIPDKLASDSGPKFTATSTTEFLKTWGVRHRLSSVAFPHSNCRAKVGVKHMITDNTGPHSELDTDAFQHVLRARRNKKQIQETKICYLESQQKHF